MRTGRGHSVPLQCGARGARAPWCDRCGRPSRVPVTSCRDCPPDPVTSARAPFLFDGPARRAVHRLKFSGWRDVAGALSSAIIACDDLPPVDVITWVPLARRRLAERGYDQARAPRRARTANGLRSSALRRARSTGPTGGGRRGAPGNDTGSFDATCASPGSCSSMTSSRPGRRPRRAPELATAGARRIHLVTAARSFHDPVPTLRVPGGRAYPETGPRPGLWLPGEPPR